MSWTFSERRVGASSIAQSFLALAAGRLLPLGATTLALALVARSLRAGLFGILVTVIAATGIAASLVDGGMLTAATREASQRPEQRRALLTVLVTARVSLACVASLAVSLFLYLVFTNTPRISLLIACATVQIIATAYSGTYLMAAQVDGRIDRYAWRDASGRVLGAALVVGAYATSKGDELLDLTLMGFAMGPILSSLLLALGFGPLRPTPFMPQCWQAAIRMFSESRFLAAAFVMNTLYFRLDAMLIVLLSNREQAGIYGVGYRIFEILLLVGGFYQISFLPVASRLGASALGGAVRQGWARMTALGLPVFFAVAPVAGTLTMLAAGPGYERAGPILQLLLPGVILGWLNSIGGTGFIAAGLERPALRINSGVLLFNLVGNIAMIPALGGAGAALMTTLSELLAFGLMLFFANRWLRVNFPHPPSGRVLLWLPVLAVWLIIVTRIHESALRLTGAVAEALAGVLLLSPELLRAVTAGHRRTGELCNGGSVATVGGGHAHQNKEDGER